MAAVCRLPGAIHPAASIYPSITMLQGHFSCCTGACSFKPREKQSKL